uniref:ABC-2 type transporter transmembrane domain-containing protein n=1 Tax=Schistocephalus solidus TaxID=70667 RepID=A0A0V0J621_SCHSO
MIAFKKLLTLMPSACVNIFRSVITNQQQQQRQQQEKQHTILNKALLQAEGVNSINDMLDDAKHIAPPANQALFNGRRSPLPFYRQFGILAQRGFLSTVRDFNGAAVYLIACAVFSLLLGFVYLKLDTSKESGIQNRLGLFFFVCLQVIFFNTNCVEVFIRDFARFRQERFKGYYCTSAYFLSKVFCEVLPVRVFPVIVFLPMLYLMAGLKADISAIAIWEVVWLATSIASCGIAILTGVVFNHLELASLFTCLVYSCMMAFSGYLLNMVSTWRVLSWLRYLSIFWYAFSAQSINELKGVEFCSLAKLSPSQQRSWAMSGVDFAVMDDETNKNSTSSQLQSCVSGSEYLETQGISFDSPWSLWSNILGLGCISFFAYISAYVRLRLLRNYVS